MLDISYSQLSRQLGIRSSYFPFVGCLCTGPISCHWRHRLIVTCMIACGRFDAVRKGIGGEITMCIHQYFGGRAGEKRASWLTRHPPASTFRCALGSPSLHARYRQLGAWNPTAARPPRPFSIDSRDEHRRQSAASRHTELPGSAPSGFQTGPCRPATRTKKADVVGTPKGVRPRRLTRQSAPRHSRVALYPVIRHFTPDHIRIACGPPLSVIIGRRTG